MAIGEGGAIGIRRKFVHRLDQLGKLTSRDALGSLLESSSKDVFDVIGMKSLPKQGDIIPAKEGQAIP